MIISEFTLQHFCLHSVSMVGFVLASPETGPGVRKDNMLLEIVVALASKSQDH